MIRLTDVIMIDSRSMKKILIASGVVAGIVLGAVGCSGSQGPPASSKTVTVTPAPDTPTPQGAVSDNADLANWVKQTGYPVMHALNVEITHGDCKSAVRDSNLALNDVATNSAPDRDVYVSYSIALSSDTVVAQECMANGGNLVYNADYSKAMRDYESFLITLQNKGLPYHP